MTWSIAPDDAGFFNYTDYEHSALRMLRLARDGVGEGGRSCGAARRGAERERRTARAVRPVPPHPAVDRARLRHPDRPRAADLRRVSPARLRRGQPAHRLPAGVSVPDLHPDGCRAHQHRRTGPHARPGLAVEFLGRQPGRGSRGAARQRLPLGHRRAGSRRQRGDRRDRLDHRGHAVQPAAARRQRRTAGRRARDPASGPRPHRRRLRRPRRVRQPDGRPRGARRNRRGRISRRRPGAPTSSIRATTICSGSKPSSATGRCRC